MEDGEEKNSNIYKYEIAIIKAKIRSLNNLYELKFLLYWVWQMTNLRVGEKYATGIRSSGRRGYS